MKEFIETRLDIMFIGKTASCQDFEEEIKYLSMKIRFIKEFISGKIKISNQKKNDIIKQLEKGSYEMKDESYDYL